MHKFFKESVKEALKYYVYALVDPRDKRIFYVGKGTGDRVFQHAEDSLNENDESLKLSTIREIHKAEKEVEYYILRHNLSDKEAYLVESTLIDLLTYNAFNRENLLTNVVKGHHQWNEGIKQKMKLTYYTIVRRLSQSLAINFFWLALTSRIYNQKPQGYIGVLMIMRVQGNTGV